MFNERELLDKTISKEGKLKSFIVGYVGDKLNPENEEVTVEMIIEVLAQDFPELVLVLAEENFFRGYSQGLQDFEQSLKITPELIKEIEDDE
jgi:hypothetical protein